MNAPKYMTFADIVAVQIPQQVTQLEGDTGWVSYAAIERHIHCSYRNACEKMGYLVPSHTLYIIHFIAEILRRDKNALSNLQEALDQWPYVMLASSSRMA